MDPWNRREWLRTALAACGGVSLDWAALPVAKAASADPDSFDAVIVGSGLGGLSCAAAFARQGFKPLVLEQHVKAGGYATAFSRPGGFNFDVSLHSTVRLNPSEWQPVTTPPVPGGLYNSVTLPMTDTASFFRRVHQAGGEKKLSA